MNCAELKNVLLWGNFTNHCRKAHNGKNKAFHITMAIIEIFPLVGQIASLVEHLLKHKGSSSKSNKFSSTHDSSSFARKSFSNSLQNPRSSSKNRSISLTKSQSIKSSNYSQATSTCTDSSKKFSQLTNSQTTSKTASSRSSTLSDRSQSNSSQISQNIQTVYPLSTGLSQNSKQNEPISLEAFKRKLKFFDYYGKNIQQVATKLFINIPKDIELTEVVNIIFEKDCAFDILFLLEAISIAHPTFTLSPYDKIRRAIVEDFEYSLTSSSIENMLKEHNLDTDEQIVKNCYDFAFCRNHPNIYRVSPTPILPNKYSLNFLWVNLNPQDRILNLAKNIFKDGLDTSENASCIKDPQLLREIEENADSLEGEDLENWGKIKKSFSYRISKWADVNPDAQLNLWYDSALVTQRAQEKTFKMMKAISKSRGVRLELRDIRTLPNITGELENALHPATPIYFRVDLLKALIADYMISSTQENAKYCVISDIDIEPMTSEQMFDQRTLDYLANEGYVFNRVGHSNFENSFYIFNKKKKGLQGIHHEVILKKASDKIAYLREFPIDSREILNTQAIYSLYSSGFRDAMKERGKLVPRKVVKCPQSQFSFSFLNSLPNSDYRKENFRFIGDSNVPYTQFGRALSHKETQIEELKDWKAEPLPLNE